MNKASLLFVAFSLYLASCSSDKQKASSENATGYRVEREPVELERDCMQPMARITISYDKDGELKYNAQWSKEAAMDIKETDLAAFLAECSAKDSEMYVALYADENIPYKELLRVLNIANENKYKMVLATRRPDTAND